MPNDGDGKDKKGDGPVVTKTPGKPKTPEAKNPRRKVNAAALFGALFDRGYVGRPVVASTQEKPPAEPTRERRAPLLPQEPEPQAEAQGELPGSPPEEDPRHEMPTTPAPSPFGVLNVREPGQRDTPPGGWHAAQPTPPPKISSHTFSSLGEVNQMLSKGADAILGEGPPTGDGMDADSFARVAGMPADQRGSLIEGIELGIMADAYAPMGVADASSKVEAAVVTFKQSQVPSRHTGTYSDSRQDGKPKKVSFREEAEKAITFIEGHEEAADGDLIRAIRSRLDALEALKRDIKLFEFLDKERIKAAGGDAEGVATDWNGLVPLLEKNAMTIRLKFFREEHLQNEEVPGRVRRILDNIYPSLDSELGLFMLEAGPVMLVSRDTEQKDLERYVVPLLEAHRRAKLFIAKSAEQMPELEARAKKYSSVLNEARKYFKVDETLICKDELEAAMNTIHKHFASGSVEQIVSKMIKEERWDYELEETPVAKAMGTAAGEIGPLFEAVFENEVVFRGLHTQEEDGRMTAGGLERQFAETIISCGKGTGQPREMNPFDAFAKGVMFAALGRRRKGALYDILGNHSVSRPYGGKLGGVPALGVYVGLDLLNKNKSNGDKPDSTKLAEAYKLVGDAPLASLIHDLVEVTTSSVNWKPKDPAIMGKFEDFVCAELTKFYEVAGDYMSPKQFLHFLTLEGVTDEDVRKDPFLQQCFGDAATDTFRIYSVPNDVFDAFLLLRQYYHSIVEPFKGGKAVKDEFFRAYMGNYSSNPFCQTFGIALFASQQDLADYEGIKNTFLDRGEKVPSDEWVSKLMKERIAALPEERRAIVAEKQVDLDTFDELFDQRVSKATMTGTLPGSDAEVDFGSLEEDLHDDIDN